jgi:molecular chaperone IbpA
MYDDVFGKSFPFAIGFDRTFQLLERASAPSNNNYPPYNIIKHDAENFSIEMAVAGFGKDDILITKEKEILSIVGGVRDAEPDDMEYIHRGLASRSFKRTFTLADDIKVESSELLDGILFVYLKREIPEEDKPQEIKIS